MVKGEIMKAFLAREEQHRDTRIHVHTTSFQGCFGALSQCNQARKRKMVAGLGNKCPTGKISGLLL